MGLLRALLKGLLVDFQIRAPAANAVKYFSAIVFLPVWTTGR
jgi:hypothetical protein